MYTEKDLQQEISEIVNGRIKQEVAIPADAITLQVLRHHIEDFKRGEDFIAFIAWGGVRKAVGGYLARITKDDQGDMRQLRMPGFDWLQRYYVVRRGEEDTAVPVGLLSYDELTLISERLEKEGHSKLKHSQEVLDYRDTRLGKTSDDPLSDGVTEREE